MAKQSTPKKRLKKLANAIPSVKQTHAVMLALEPQQNTFGDYAIAIIGSGLVEKALEAVILTRFINLEPDERNGIFNYEGNGPLSDLSAKIKIAYALGLFGPKTRDDLEYIRTIRNSFAHSLNLLRFETEEVAEVCALLNTPSTIKFADRLLLAVANMDAPRGRYIVTTLALAGRLQGTLATAKSVRLTRRGAEIIGNLGLP
jgi:Mannitol repressor